MPTEPAAAPPPAPAGKQGKGKGNVLTRKLGPLPGWAWILVGGGAYYLYTRYKASQTASTASTATPLTSATPSSSGGSGGYGGGPSSGGYGGGGSGPGGPTGPTPTPTPSVPPAPSSTSTTPTGSVTPLWHPATWTSPVTAGTPITQQMHIQAPVQASAIAARWHVPITDLYYRDWSSGKTGRLSGPQLLHPGTSVWIYRGAQPGQLPAVATG